MHISGAFAQVPPMSVAPHIASAENEQNRPSAHGSMPREPHASPTLPPASLNGV